MTGAKVPPPRAIKQSGSFLIREGSRSPRLLKDIAPRFGVNIELLLIGKGRAVCSSTAAGGSSKEWLFCSR